MDKITVTNGKISFESDSKLVDSVPLNVITNVGPFQSLDQEDESKKSRFDKIDEYYNDLSNIISSKVHGTYKKYKVGDIRAIYFLIFDKNAGPKKNDNIDAIVKWYKTKYVPRVTGNKGTTSINTVGPGVNFNKVDVPFFEQQDKKEESESDEDEESEDEAEF